MFGICNNHHFNDLLSDATEFDFRYQGFDE